MLQPWMRKEVLTKFGRTTTNKWQPQSNERNPFTDFMRSDIDPLPIEKRIRYWKLARGDRVNTTGLNTIDRAGTSSKRGTQGERGDNKGN